MLVGLSDFLSRNDFYALHSMRFIKTVIIKVYINHALSAYFPTIFKSIGKKNSTISETFSRYSSHFYSCYHNSLCTLLEPG